MKKLLSKKLFFWMLPLFVFGACNKDGVKVVATQGTPSDLTASTQALNYTTADSANDAISFSWGESDFGYSAAVTYYLQFSYKDSDFSKVYSLAAGNALSQSFKVADFNTIVLGAKYTAGQQNTVSVRVKAQISDSNYVYSNVLQITVTPYQTERVITYPPLYVPGDYQGWGPGSAIIAKLYSPADNKVYDGYINLPSDTNYFKFTAEPDWDGTNYGSGDNIADGGGLSTDGGAGNLMVVGAGYYLLHADIPNLKWTATLQNWGIIGDFNSWGTDVPFDFDEVNQVLVKTIQLPAGGFKFRANQSWEGNDANPNYGGTYDPTSGNVALSLGGGNITIPTAGTYKITLDLRVPSEPVCTIAQQ
ncbi:hypothetical protein A9P82_11445 [Arachidicoccus ginsenosidimutans]|uniref:SusE domain-containing protein n=1 Tax=Arachidicoccus sp. BS20 TaxID=1850526 RepID=UPI0007F0BCE7|nr:SusE domain-containing protein [Arachidicoccus sp. BS20]ANI89847.1 hypothetical protein A9P82_11445 [Arachidicoccus sp. BS20]